MCHNLQFPGLDEVLDMFFGTRPAWWRPNLNYCANVIRGRHRAAAVLAAAKPIVEGTWILEELARIVAEHRNYQRENPRPSLTG
jgi:hypothetical protein